MKRFKIIFCSALLGIGATQDVVLAADLPPQDPTLRDLRTRTYPINKQAKTSAVAGKSMEGYKTFLDSPLGGVMRREAQRRLADQIIERLEDIETAKASEVKSTVAQPDLGVEISYASAIKLYNSALKDFTGLPGNDHILYQLVRAYESNAEPNKALETLEELIKKHSNSNYTEEALFRRAELSFLLRKYDKAEASYKELMTKYEKSRYYDISNYKSGWAQFKQDKFEPALKTFFALLDKSILGMPLEDYVAGIPKLTGGNRELMKDTMRVISLTFSHMDGAKGIASYLGSKENKREYDFLIYQDLAETYQKEDRYQDAADVYQAFIRNNPTHPQAPFIKLMTMEAFRKGGFVEPYLVAKKEFAGDYAMSQPFWAEQSALLKEQVLPYLREHLGELAKHYHAEAQKTQKLDDQKAAIHWYTLYLDSFPKDDDSAHMNFLLAELLFDVKDFERAAIEYERTAYSYGQHADAQEAGYAALLAYDEQKKMMPAGEARAVWTRKQVISAVQFAKNNRKDARVPGMLTKAAQELFELREYDNAIKVAREVVGIQPVQDKEMHRSAWLVIAHSEFETQAFRRAEASYKQALTLTGKTDGRYGELQERIAATIYKLGEEQRDKGNMRGAVREFARVGEETPLSSIRQTADLDAATALIVLKDWSAAIKLLEPMRGTPFGVKHDAAITQKLVVAYMEHGDIAKAATQLEKLASFESDYELQRDAVWRAAQLYEKSGDIDGAIGAYQRYIKQFGYPLEDSIEARQKLADIYLARKSVVQYEHWLNQIIDADKTAESTQRTTRTRYLAAKASFDLARPAFDRYTEIKLVDPIKENLKLKKASMQEVIKAYSGSAEYSIAEFTTGSTFMIAEIYRDFASALMKSARPKELDAEELEQYNLMIEEQAYPFEEKSIDLYEQNVQRVKQNIYDEWVKRSYGALAKLKPGRYDKTERSEPYVDVLN